MGDILIRNLNPQKTKTVFENLAGGGTKKFAIKFFSVNDKNEGYILSGADIPRRVRPFFRTCPVAAVRRRRKREDESNEADGADVSDEESEGRIRCFW